jgi:hypothetical protein
MLGYRRIVPVTGMDTLEALQYLKDCLDRRAELAVDIGAGMAKVGDLLDVYRVELRRFFTEASA